MKDRKSGEKTVGVIQSDSVERMVEETIKSRHPETVAELFRIVREKKPDVTREELVEIVKRLRDNEKIELELPPPRVGAYLEYLRVKSENMWFFLVVVASIVVLLAVYVIPNTYPLVVLRWVVGSIFVLFLPGFVVMQALFPSGKELDDIERFALSVGLSIAITPLIGLLLNYTPWGIRLDPVITSLFMFTLSIAIIATYRKYRAVLSA